MSIELDRRNLPFSQQPEKEASHPQNKQTMGMDAFPVDDYTSHTPAQPHTPKKSTILLLSTALAVMTILVAIAAAVGATIAVERKHEINRLEKLLDDRCAANSTAISGDEDFASSSTPSVASATTSTSAASSTPTSAPDDSIAPATASTSAASSTPTPTPYDPDKNTIVPSSNCSAMGSTYISASSQAPFIIRCQTDYPGSDMLAVWVFTFADCMEACAYYNAQQNTQRCYAVSYDRGDSFAERSGLGNCWLKDSSNVAALSKNASDSGVFNLDS